MYRMNGESYRDLWGYGELIPYKKTYASFMTLFLFIDVNRGKSKKARRHIARDITKILHSYLTLCIFIL